MKIVNAGNVDWVSLIVRLSQCEDVIKSVLVSAFPRTFMSSHTSNYPSIKAISASTILPTSCTQIFLQLLPLHILTSKTRTTQYASTSRNPVLAESTITTLTITLTLFVTISYHINNERHEYYPHFSQNHPSPLGNFHHPSMLISRLSHR